MFDLAEFEALSVKRDYLAAVAKRHMGHAYTWPDVEEVVQAGLLAAWKYRNRMRTDHTVAFTLVCLSKVAAKWCRRDIVRRRHAYDDVNFINYRNPESELLAKEKVQLIESASRKLPLLRQKQYSEWIARDYKNETHLQKCEIWHCKRVIREILVKQKVMKAAA